MNKEADPTKQVPRRAGRQARSSYRFFDKSMDLEGIFSASETIQVPQQMQQFSEALPQMGNSLNEGNVKQQQASQRQGLSVPDDVRKHSKPLLNDKQAGGRIPWGFK